jgi:hypothetical protein
MPQYMLLMYNPAEQDAEARQADYSSEDMKAQQRAWADYVRDLKEAGAWKANNGLAGTEAATTVRVRDGETQINDGPFAETKELLAGYFLVEVDDLDTALKWAARIPSAGWGSVEVRPVWG